MKDDEVDDGWGNGTPDSEPEREPSVQISMGDDRPSVVRSLPRKYETLRPFEEDHWTPGLSAAPLGNPLPPKLPDEHARGSTDIPVIAEAVGSQPIARGTPDFRTLPGIAPQVRTGSAAGADQREAVRKAVLAAALARGAEQADAIKKRPTVETDKIEPTKDRPGLQTDAIVQLARIKQRNRKVAIGAAIGVPALLGVAFLLGRRPAEAPVVVPQPVIAEPRPAPAPTEKAERSLAESLFDRAEIAIRNGRIAAPPGDNALELVLDAEKLEPASPRSKAIRTQAIDALLAAADQLWTAGKQDSARTMYADALLFDPSIERAKTRATWKASEPVAVKRDVAWLVAEIDLAIIERRLVAPAGRNALELLQQLRRVDPNNEAVRRLGVEVGAAIAVEAKTKPADPHLQAAAKPLTTKPADPKPEITEKPRDPALAAQLVKQGNGALAGGRLADARSSFERAVAADSAAHAALAGLAEVAYNESDYTRAVLAAKRAIALAPASAGYRMTLAKAYYKLLRYDDAIAQWKKVIQLDPANTAAQKNIEMAEHRLGH